MDKIYNKTIINVGSVGNSFDVIRNESKDIEDTTLIIITFTTELLEENILFNKEEILDVKWISKEELINMTDKELRDEKRIKITLQMLEENKVYPLDAIKILEYIN